jgi:hypothetical protein
LANSKVSASTLTSANLETATIQLANNQALLSKQDVIDMLNASQVSNINIDLAPLNTNINNVGTQVKVAKTTTSRQIQASKKVNADD